MTDIDDDYVPEDVLEWVRDKIEGVGGMNDFEKYELVIWHESERISAGYWVIRCLANPKSRGSKAVLDAIMEKRGETLAITDYTPEDCKHYRLSRIRFGFYQIVLKGEHMAYLDGVDTDTAEHITQLLDQDYQRRREGDET
jgi:hypothetical protein